MAIVMEHAYDVMEAYEPLIPLDDLAEVVYGGFQTLVHDAPMAQTRVSEMLAGLDAQVDAIIDGGLSDAERGFLNVITPEALEADRLFILSNEDANAHVSFQAVGFFGAYMTVYDDAGGTYQLDSPQTYTEYMASPWKDMWTQAMIKEVDKLEDQNTWIRVPRSWSKGYKVHKVKGIWTNKLDPKLRLDRRKYRCVIVGIHFDQGLDYLEHFTAGAPFGALRLKCVVVTHKIHLSQLKPEGAKLWVKFAFDVTNAFPHEPADRKIFIELPKGPWDWRDPVSGEEQIGLLQRNLYGTPPGPRVFALGFKKHCNDNGCLSSLVEPNDYHRVDGDDGEKEVSFSTYVDEAYGGASSMDEAIWVRDMLQKKYAITWRFEWQNMLGFGVEEEPGKPLAFTSAKYTRSLVEKFLPGESKPERSSASRDTITKLHEVVLPELDGPEDLAMRGMQSSARSLCGGIGHLTRGRVDLSVDHALCSQHVARPSYEVYEHLKEQLRFAWATEDSAISFPGTINGIPINGSVVKYHEPIRPYDAEVFYGLEAIGDAAHVTPQATVPASKSMGGLSIRLAGGPLEWCSFRFHTITTDSTSAETLVATRAAMRLVYYRRLMQHNRIILLGPSPLFTDNDGVWYVARDAMATTRMLYVIRHVRMLQQAEYDGEITTFQVDGVLNPTDALTKWLQARTRVHHNLFLAGYPEAARRVWQASKAFATFKPKKITPVPRPPPVDPNMDAMLNLEATRLSNDAQVVLQEEAARTNLA